MKIKFYIYTKKSEVWLTFERSFNVIVIIFDTSGKFSTQLILHSLRKNDVK